MKRVCFLLIIAFTVLGQAFASMVTVYFDKTGSPWNDVYYFTWDGRGHTPSGEWPGTKFTDADRTTFKGRNVYKAEVDDAWQIIFSNGKGGVQNGNQTVDLPIKGDYIYTSTTTVEDVKGSVEIEPMKPTGTLPVLYIICEDDAILSKDLADKDYRSATYWLDANGMNGWKNVGSEEDMLPLEIKARGNFTRTAFSKKPFKIKLGKKQNLLGLTPEKSKHYALLAHADDFRGYLRNFIGFNLGKRMDTQLPWTPGMTPMELVINGDYRGVYFLTESVRVGDGRIDIVELGDNVEDSELISGGYIVELDNYPEDAVIFLDDQWHGDLMITPDTPEVYSNLQHKFIEDQFTCMNSLVHSHSDELWSYLDLDAVAAYYVVNEIIDHWEAFHGSTYLFRDYGEGQKWTFSPLWDCGNAFQRGSQNQSYFTEGSAFGNNWINELRKNEKFMDKVKEIWRWFWGTQVETLYDDIDAYTASLKAAAVRDHERWGNAPLPNGSNSQVQDNSDMESKASDVKRYLKSKTEWLSQVWGQPNPMAEMPEKDTTEAAPLPEYAKSGIERVENDYDDAGEAVYYDLHGRRVANPQSGTILVRRTPRGASLIIK